MRRLMISSLAVVVGLVLGVAALAAETGKPSSAQGTVTGVDVKERTISLRTEAGKLETFKLDDKTHVMGANDSKLAITDVKVGEEVHITYTMTGETRWASQVKVKPAKTAQNRPAKSD